MATQRGHGTLTMIDFEHESAQTRWQFNFTDGSLASDIQTSARGTANLLAACSNGTEKEFVALYREFNTSNVPAKAGAYPNSEDKLLLDYFDSVGNTVRYQIMAPLDSNFQADQETVDPTSATISALTANLTAAAGADGYQVVSNAGNPIVGLYRGQRLRKRGKKEAPGYFQAIG